MELEEKVNMIRYSDYCRNLVALHNVNISEDKLAILFDMKMNPPASMQSLPLSLNIRPSQAI